jgi:hypothetical protein
MRKTVKGVADTTDLAFAEAQREMPPDAHTVEKRELIPPALKELTVEAFDEQSARTQLESQIGTTEMIRVLSLIMAGQKGFFGIGRKPNQYRAEVFQQAVVEVTFNTKAKIVIKVGKTIMDQDVVPTVKAIWIACPERLKYGQDPALVCWTDYCCVDMVISHDWPGTRPSAPKCTNQEMIDFIVGLRREQLYLLKHVYLDDALSWTERTVN